MPASSSDRLKEQIESIPVMLRKALERQAKARIAVVHLEAQISKLEAEIEREDNQKDIDNFESDDLEGDLELLKLESNGERLKLQVTEAEDKVEMAFRASTAKTTEGHVRAAVGSDPTVIRLRREGLDAKEAARKRKITLQRERQAEREAKLQASARVDIVPENEKISVLQEQLEEAQEEVILADVEVEVVRTMVDTYEMLVQLP